MGVVEWDSSRECKCPRGVVLLGVGLVVLRMGVSWCFECFFSSSSFFWLTFSLQSKLLHESVCACELALHFGWVSARPPCQPPPIQGRPGSGSLLSSASCRKAGGCNIPGAICNFACSGRIPSSSHRGRSRGGQRGAGEGPGAFAHTQKTPGSCSTKECFMVAVVSGMGVSTDTEAEPHSHINVPGRASWQFNCQKQRHRSRPCSSHLGILLPPSVIELQAGPE